MPYLPVSEALRGALPGNGADLTFSINRNNERYRLFYPKIAYYSLDVSTGAPDDPDAPFAIVQTGDATAFDPLYMETVPRDMANGYADIAGDGDVDTTADAVDVFADPVDLFTRIEKGVADSAIKEYGWERGRDLVCYVPCAMLDAAGITVKPGDKFTWNRNPYTVEEESPTGYWKNTDVPLFRVLNCSRRRAGS